MPTPGSAKSHREASAGLLRGAQENPLQGRELLLQKPASDLVEEMAVALWKSFGRESAWARVSAQWYFAAEVPPARTDPVPSILPLAFREHETARRMAVRAPSVFWGGWIRQALRLPSTIGGEVRDDQETSRLGNRRVAARGPGQCSEPRRALPEGERGNQDELLGDALKTLDQLDAESQKPGMEAQRKQLEPALALYRGVAFANLGKTREAKDQFEAYLATNPTHRWIRRRTRRKPSRRWRRPARTSAAAESRRSPRPTSRSGSRRLTPRSRRCRSGPRGLFGSFSERGEEAVGRSQRLRGAERVRREVLGLA